LERLDRLSGKKQTGFRAYFELYPLVPHLTMQYVSVVVKDQAVELTTAAKAIAFVLGRAEGPMATKEICEAVHGLAKQRCCHVFAHATLKQRLWMMEKAGDVAKIRRPVRYSMMQDKAEKLLGLAPMDTEPVPILPRPSEQDVWMAALALLMVPREPID